MDPNLSQLHTSLQRAVFRLQQEVTGSEARFKPTLPEKSVKKLNRINALMGYANMISSHGVGQVVSVLAFYFNNPSSNPADTYCFSVLFMFAKTENKQKRPGLAYFPIFPSEVFY